MVALFASKSIQNIVHSNKLIELATSLHIQVQNPTKK